MTTPLWCLVATALIPYGLAGFGAYMRQQQLGSVDNKNWRHSQLPNLTGAGARAYSAQANAWEAVAFFTVCVLVAHLSGADPQASATAALAFLVARVLHAVLYIADLDKLRTVVFLVGWGACLYLVYLAAQAT